MKYLKLTNSKFLLLGSFFLLFTVTNCKKNNVKEDVKIDKVDKNSIAVLPSTNPQILNNVQLDLQLRNLAAGFAGIFSNSSINTIGTTSLTNILTSNFPPQDNELPIYNYYNTLLNNSSGPINKFAINGNLPTNPNTNDLYDVITYSKSTFVANPNFNSWITNFFTYFTIGAESYYTLLRVPEFSTQGNYPSNATTPIIFLAENVLGTTTYDGYMWNNVNNSVSVVPALNDDIIEDHIDNKTAYIIVVGYDKLIEGTTAGGLISSSCDGVWSCFDDYCDEKCGESETCLDCQGINNKNLYLVEVKILNDERTTKGGTTTVIDNHFVDNLGGKYKLSLNSVVLHANGKWDAINDEDIRPKWKQDEVHRVKIKNNGNRRSKGTNTWKTVFLKGDAAGEAAGKGILISKNFNPKKAIIHISLNEEDNPFGKKRDFFPPTYLGVGISNNQEWISQGMPTLCGPAKNAFFHNDAANPTTFPMLDVMNQIMPVRWIDSVTGTLLDEITITALGVSYKLKYE